MRNAGPGIMEKTQMFGKCEFCKVFEATSEKPTGWTFHSHDYTQIWYVTKGCCEHWVEGQRYVMTCGDTFIMPPFMVHKTILRKDSAILCCEVALEDILPLKGGGGSAAVSATVLDQIFITLLMQRAGHLKTDFAFSPETEQSVCLLLENMLREYNEEQLYYQDFLRVQIQELLLLFAREFETSPEYNASVVVYNKNKVFVERAIQYIGDHYAEPLTLERVCKVSTLSKTNFCYLFKLMTRQTFVEYLVNLRIRKAKDMLVVPSFSITYIGEAVGFNDSTHFSRTFHKITGVSPREFRALKTERTADRA